VNILLDTCVSSKAKAALQAAGYDVVWSGDWPIDPGDPEIMRRAYAEGRVLITLDKDFGELAIVSKLPHCGIVRLVGVRPARQGPLCLSLLAKYNAELKAGSILTAELFRTRVRPPDSED
jgi:predicted nuclease of predicted toxin-antitoxin system